MELHLSFKCQSNSFLRVRITEYLSQASLRSFFKANNSGRRYESTPANPSETNNKRPNTRPD